MPATSMDMPLFLAGAGAGIGGLVLGIERLFRLVIAVRDLSRTGGVDPTVALTVTIDRVAASFVAFETQSAEWRVRLTALMENAATGQKEAAAAMYEVSRGLAVLLDRSKRE